MSRDVVLGFVTRRMKILINGGGRLFQLQWLLIIYIACTSTAAQRVPGFVSIDCGTQDYSYVEPSTEIFWESDGAYTNAGSSFETGISLRAPYPAVVNILQAGSIKYFIFRSAGHRDCYELPVQKEETYLLRATFHYGPLLARPQTDSGSGSFEVWVDSNSWLLLTWDNNTIYDFSGTFEMIYNSANQTNLNLCLVQIEGPSFITSLELRKLASGMYAAAVGPTKSSWMSTVERASFGPLANGTAGQWRFPNDTYDRIWNISETNRLISNPNVLKKNTSSALQPDRPPWIATQNAWISDGDSILVTVPSVPASALTFAGPNPTLYIATYFQEFDGNASATNVRGMNYFMNGRYVESFNVTDAPSEIIRMERMQQSLNLSFTKTNWSSLKPCLNAFEVYLVKPWITTRTAPEDVSALHAVGTALRTSWDGDPCLPQPVRGVQCSYVNGSPRITSLSSLYNEGRNIPTALSNFRELTTLDLRCSNFNGGIPDLSSLVHLEALYLQGNSLSGPIPAFLGTAFPNLTRLNLDDNNFSGAVPSSLNRPGLNFTVLNNPSIVLWKCTVPACGSNPPSPPVLSPENSAQGSRRSAPLLAAVAIGCVIGGLVGLGIVGGMTWMACTRKTRARLRVVKALRQAENQTELPNQRARNVASSMSVLTLTELNEATKKFCQKIGEGAFGPVYYGKLSTGEEVAVKVKKRASHQGMAEFVNEVELLSRIHHRNLVSLVAFCEEENQQILVYVYVSNGNLRDHLYGKKSSKSLDWTTRLDIALNSAKGIEYLHSDCHPRIIHRDIKSTNILLDKDMVAKVSDFGISKEAPEGVFSGVKTTIKGTLGYLDPEYFRSQKLTQNSDVYSFGIVLLEIISGRHPLNSDFPDGTSESLLEWVESAIKKGMVMEIIDPSLNGKFDKKSMRKVISLAMRSVHPTSTERPNMTHVVHVLQEAIKLELTSNVSPTAIIHPDVNATLVEDASEDATFISSLQVGWSNQASHI